MANEKFKGIFEVPIQRSQRYCRSPSWTTSSTTRSTATSLAMGAPMPSGQLTLGGNVEKGNPDKVQRRYGHGSNDWSVQWQFLVEIRWKFVSCKRCSKEPPHGSGPFFFLKHGSRNAKPQRSLKRLQRGAGGTVEQRQSAHGTVSRGDGQDGKVRRNSPGRNPPAWQDPGSVAEQSG